MFDLKSERAGLWTARGLIIVVAIALGCYTWARWGDIQMDCGREMYVPVDILRGKLLYRDIWYQYGPLTPYLQALAFAFFGINLTVLYAMGMTLVITSALLLFEIARNFELVLPAAIVPAIFFLAQSFRPSIFNFIFPYSYAASLAACFGLACLFFTVRHALTGRVLWLASAAFCTSLALLTKQEFGIACLVIVGFETLASCMNRSSWGELIKNGVACAAGLAPALFVYGFLIWKVSARTIFIDNWVMMPGSYTMRTIAHHKLAGDGVRFGLSEWTNAAVGASVAVTLWFFIACANGLAIKRLRLQRLFFFVLLLEADLVVILLVVKVGSAAWAGLPGLIGQMLFPKGIFLLACAFMTVSIWKVWRTHGQAYKLAEAALGTYAVLVGMRVMMEMWPVAYAVFYNGPTFLVYTILVARAIAGGSARLDVKRRDLLVGCMLTVEGALLMIALVPPRGLLDAKIKSEFGTIYTSADRAALFPEIVSFMKAHTRNGRDILVLPESPSLYFFSGMESPSRWYEAQPGVLNPKQELELIKEAESSHVQYVLLHNRSVSEYGIAPFGIGYDRAVNKWLTVNFTKTGQFGPRTDLLPSDDKQRVYEPYLIQIYERTGK